MTNTSLATSPVLFSWHKIVEERRIHALLLLSLLKIIVGDIQLPNVVKGVNVESYYPAMCIAGEVLLKERCTHMSLVHHLIGVFLHHGDINKVLCLVSFVL